MKVGLKFRIYPDKQQQQLIHQTTGNNRFTYNYFLAQKNTWWQQNKDLPKEQRTKSLSSFDCIKLLPQLKKELFSISKDKINEFVENNYYEPIDWMTITGEEYESLKSYWLDNGLSSALQQKLKHLDEAFQDFFKGKKGYPAFKKKSSSDSFTITPNNWRFYFKDNLNFNDKISDKNLDKHNQKNKLKDINNVDLKLTFNNTVFKLSNSDKPLKIKFNKKLLNQNIDVTKISQVTISYNSTGQYFISFLVEEELTNLKNKNFTKDKDNYLKNCDNDGNHQKVITSIDVGIKNSLNILNNQEYITKKLQGLKRHEKRLRRVQKSLSRKVKNSKNFNKQKLRVAKEHNDLVNYRTDFYHKASTEIVLNSDKIILENLNIKGMMKNKKLSKSIGHQSWGQFMTMVKYKATWYNKELVILERFFPSSKLCSHCHVYNSHVEQQDKWQCFNCLSHHQRDENAVNTMQNYEAYRKEGKSYIHETYQDIEKYNELINSNQLNKKTNNKGNNNNLNKKLIGKNQANNKSLNHKGNLNKNTLPLTNNVLLREQKQVDSNQLKPVEKL